MNQIILMGRLTNDPDVRYSQNGSAVANLSLAVNRKFKREGDPDADFFRCVAFGKTAESIEKYLLKGVKVIVTGEMQNDNYEKDGIKHYQMKVILKDWEFAESKKAADETATTTNDGFMPVPGDMDLDMPFA